MIERHIVLMTNSARPHKAQWLQPWAKTLEESGYHVTLISLEDTELPQRDWTQTHAVIEWLPTGDGFKESIVRQLDARLPKNALHFSAAYSVMTTTIASWCTQPERIIGFSPLGLHRNTTTVTLAHHRRSTAEIRQRATTMMAEMGMTPQWIQDTPGLVMPRIYAMLANEAAFALQESVAQAQDIDTAMRLGTNYPMGPLAWADTIGVDVVVIILNHLWTVYREDRYRPCLLLQQMVQAGHTGKNAGQGFYTYTPEKSAAEARR